MFSFTRQVLQSLHGQFQSLNAVARNLCTNKFACRQILGTSSGYQNSSIASTFRPTITDSSSLNLHQQHVRSYMRVFYKPSAWKRYNKHNIEKRLTTPGGLEILWRRVLKGRHNLAVYERILPNTIDCKILQKHQTRFRKHPLTKRKLPKPGLF